MMNQNVINFLNQVREILLDDKSWLESTTQQINEAFDTAISALQAQNVPDINVGDMISRQAAIYTIEEHKSALMKIFSILMSDKNTRERSIVDGMDYALADLRENVPSAQPQRCSDILDELKDDDYYNYIHTGHSRFSEDDWDYLIRNAKEKEKLHERLDIKAGGN